MSNADVALVPEPESEKPPAATAQASRAARALIGWMKPDDAHRAMMSNRGDMAIDANQILAVQQAHSAVAARPEGVDQHGVLMDIGSDLDLHAAALRRTPAGAQMFAQGYRIAKVDLTRICGFQPTVFSDRAIERVAGVDPSSLTSMAEVTLPLAADPNLPVQFDPVRQTIMVSSPDLNLRVVGLAGPVPVPGGPPIFGFGIALNPSYMQVVEYRGRHFLRDGYHRAYGLLTRGITVVPAFVREMTAFEEVVPDPRGMLPQDAYQGPRPPKLPDYLDDTVSAAASLPAPHKLLVIQALELMPVA